MKKKRNIASYIFVAVFCIAFPFALSLLNNENPFKISTLVFAITNTITGLGVVFIFNKIISDNSRKSVSQLKKRLIPSFIFFVLAVIVIAFLFMELGLYVLFLLDGYTTSDFLSQIFNMRYTGVIISLAGGIFFGSIVFFYATWKQAVDRQQQLREENLKYRYKTLKAQINPHFLFNSLNTLSEMVYEDAGKADNYIHKLSGTYRYILDNEETDLILLNEEIGFVKQYFDLQKERDGDKIQLEIDFRNADKFKIIPISLQTLVENALKHNSASEADPLKICIYGGDEDYITVSNNMQRKNILNSSHKTGLLNLGERVKLILGKDMAVEIVNNKFTIKLPITRI